MDIMELCPDSVALFIQEFGRELELLDQIQTDLEVPGEYL